MRADFRFLCSRLSIVFRLQISRLSAGSPRSQTDLTFRVPKHEREISATMCRIRYIYLGKIPPICLYLPIKVPPECRCDPIRARDGRWRGWGRWRRSGSETSFFFKQTRDVLSSPATHLPAGREDTSHFQRTRSATSPLVTASQIQPCLEAP